ncbi:hypothetical protein BZM26_09940 [Paraburkholderia strydomiana]|nr:hypothetical protein BZM26_09940 [Paraburkholderia strydomiana]
MGVKQAKSAARWRRLWTVLAVICVIEAAGMFVIAPIWNGGSMVGEIHALAVFIASAGLSFFSLATTAPGAALWTHLSRFVFAAAVGLAFDVVVTWALWAVGFPIVNGTVRRGLMEESYWLGPVIMAYAVIMWLSYRRNLAKEG